MGLLTTLFLITVNVYGSVKAPPNRKFSYIEKWYLGIQLTIMTAIVEYGIILASMKLSSKKMEETSSTKAEKPSVTNFATFSWLKCNGTFVIKN